MPEKPRNRPPARSHKQQTLDRRNGQPQKPAAPQILSDLHKAASPAMIAKIAEVLMNYGGVANWPSMNEIIGRTPPNATPPIGGPFDYITKEGLATNPLAQEQLREYNRQRHRR